LFFDDECVTMCLEATTVASKVRPESDGDERRRRRGGETRRERG
jgi:hypothetical protein